MTWLDYLATVLGVLMAGGLLVYLERLLKREPEGSTPEQDT